MYTVKLFASFRNGREKTYEFDLDQFSTGKEILDHLNIDSEEVAIYLINGKKSTLDHQIEEGDTVSIFPPVGGG